MTRLIFKIVCVCLSCTALKSIHLHSGGAIRLISSGFFLFSCLGTLVNKAKCILGARKETSVKSAMHMRTQRSVVKIFEKKGGEKEKLSNDWDHELKWVARRLDIGFTIKCNDKQIKSTIGRFFFFFK